MKWSQLKKRIEDTFADSVRGRVEVWNTRYRRPYDQGEAWITIDKQRVYSMGTLTWYAECNQEANRLRAERHCTEVRDPEQRDDYYRVWREAEKKAEGEGLVPAWKVNAALDAYLNMPIHEIISSTNPIIRAIGMLDRRLGKRRIAELHVQGEHALVKLLYEFRRMAEGIRTSCHEVPENDQPPSPAAANQPVS